MMKTNIENFLLCLRVFLRCRLFSLPHRYIYSMLNWQFTILIGYTLYCSLWVCTYRNQMSSIDLPVTFRLREIYVYVYRCFFIMLFLEDYAWLRVVNTEITHDIHKTRKEYITSYSSRDLCIYWVGIKSKYAHAHVCVCTLNGASTCKHNTGIRVYINYEHVWRIENHCFHNVDYYQSVSKTF